MMGYNQLLRDFCRGNRSCESYSTVYLFLVAAFASWGVISAVAIGFYMVMRSWRRQTRARNVDPMTHLDNACKKMRTELSLHVDNAQVVRGLECLVNIGTTSTPAVNTTTNEVSHTSANVCGYCENSCDCSESVYRPENPIVEALSKPVAASASTQSESTHAASTQIASTPKNTTVDTTVTAPANITTGAPEAHPVTNYEKFQFTFGQPGPRATGRTRKSSAEDALKDNPLFRLVSKNLEISRCQRANDDAMAQRLIAERDQAIIELPFATRVRAPVATDETINMLTRLQLQIENTTDAEEIATLRAKRDELRATLRANKKQQLENENSDNFQ